MQELSDTSREPEKGIFNWSKALNLSLGRAIQEALPRELRDKIYEEYFRGYDLDLAFRRIWPDWKHLDFKYGTQVPLADNGDLQNAQELDPWHLSWCIGNEQEESLNAWRCPILILKPDFMGIETAREAQSMFWRMSTFRFQDGWTNSSTYGRDGQYLLLDQLGLFLATDIRTLGVTPRDHARHIVIYTRWIDTYDWSMPKALLEVPYQRCVKLVVTATHRDNTLTGILDLLHTMLPVLLKLRKHGIELSLSWRWPKRDMRGKRMLKPHRDTLENTIRTYTALHTRNLQGFFERPEEGWKSMVVEQYAAVNTLTEKEEKWAKQGPYVSRGIPDLRPRAPDDQVLPPPPIPPPWFEELAT
jgi:hypothetical protein